MAPSREQVIKKEIDNANKAIQGVLKPQTWGFGGAEGMKPSKVEAPSIMSKTALASAKAVGFFTTTKVGALLVSGSASNGFFVKNLGWKDGKPTWSAPLFFDVTTAGVGPTLGYETVTTCYCLMTEEAVEKFTKKKPVLGMDIHVRDGFNQVKQQTGRDGEDWSVQELGLHWHTDDLIAFNVAHGAMVNIAINGGTMTPSSVNKTLYNKSFVADEVLNGGVSLPEFAPIIDQLTQLAVEGATLIKWMAQQGAEVRPAPGM